MRNMISLVLLILFVACAPQADFSAEETNSQTDRIPVTTASSQPASAPPETDPADLTSLTDTATATMIDGTPTSTPTPDPCLDLLSPENGTYLPASGQITFQWEPRQSAQSYLMTLTLPTGIREQSRTEDTRIKQFAPTTTRSGPYQWTVAAYDSEGQFICDSGSFTFTRLSLSGNPSVTATYTFIIPPTGTSSITPSDTPTPTPTFILPPTVLYTRTLEPTPTRASYP